MRAHGAWVYLFASIASGAIVGAGRRIEPLMLVGTGVVGAFLVTAAVSAGVKRKARQFAIGLMLAVIAPLAALLVDAEPAFLIVAVLAVLPAGGAVFVEKKYGFLSRSALLTGNAALVCAAPMVAVAGGTSATRAALLFVLLWTFFGWRTLSTAAPLAASAAWDRQELRSRGLREAAIAAAWTLAVVLCLKIF